MPLEQPEGTGPPSHDTVPWVRLWLTHDLHAALQVTPSNDCHCHQCHPICPHACHSFCREHPSQPAQWFPDFPTSRNPSPQALGSSCWNLCNHTLPTVTQLHRGKVLKFKPRTPTDQQCELGRFSPHILSTLCLRWVDSRDSVTSHGSTLAPWKWPHLLQKHPTFPLACSIPLWSLLQAAAETGLSLTVISTASKQQCACTHAHTHPYTIALDLVRGLLGSSNLGLGLRFHISDELAKLHTVTAAGCTPQMSWARDFPCWWHLPINLEGG